LSRSIRVLLIEPSEQHLEFLYSQIIMLLCSGCTVSAGLCRKSFETDLISSIKNRVKFIIRNEKEPVLIFLLRLQIHAILSSTDLIIFNSLEKLFHKLLYLCFFWFTPVAEIIHKRHNVMEKSGMIDRLIELKMVNIGYYRKLSTDEMMNYRISKKVNFFYPIHTRNFLRNRSVDRGRFGNRDLINIGFIGDNVITTEDYLELIERISLLDVKYRNKIGSFYFFKVNKKNSEIISEKMAEKRLSGNVTIINQCNCYEEFYRMVENLHFIVPFVKITPCGSILRDQTGLNRALSMALIVKRPLILSDNFQLEMTLQPIAVFYPDESIESGITAALEMQPEKYNKICFNFSNLDEASEEMQVLLYRKMLRSSLKRC
jgi:hypothetical protein